MGLYIGYTFCMSEVLWRMLWIATLTVATAYGSYIFLGNLLKTDNSRELREVIASDIVSPGEHRISGMIMVPSQCHGLSVHVQQTTPSSYLLAFETWEEPYRDCPREEAVREFHAVTFAPSIGATFNATLDGKPFSLQLLEQYRKKNE